MREVTHAVLGLAPVADAFDGTVTSDIVSLRNHQECEFRILKGIGATGTATITVEACDDVSGSTTSAIPFKYQVITSGDTHGALTSATTAGFTTTAGSTQMYRIYVDAQSLASTGYEFVRLKSVEVVNSPVVGAIDIILSSGKDQKQVGATAIV